MTKNQLRTLFKCKRNKLSEKQINFLSNEISLNFKALNFDVFDKKICSFLPIKQSKEVNTYFLLESLINEKAKILLTKTNFQSKRIIPHLVHNIFQTKTNSLGIPEPIEDREIDVREIELIIIPLLGFDKYGHRVGYGGGFYDLFLKNTQAKKIGVSLFDIIIEIDDLESHDIPLDYCITPFNIYSFGPKL